MVLCHDLPVSVSVATYGPAFGNGVRVGGGIVAEGGVTATVGVGGGELEIGVVRNEPVVGGEKM